jgi:GDP-D-mannose dehydratase
MRAAIPAKHPHRMRSSMKKALITGITGQDGAYLAEPTGRGVAQVCWLRAVQRQDMNARESIQ